MTEKSCLYRDLLRFNHVDFLEIQRAGEIPAEVGLVGFEGTSFRWISSLHLSLIPCSAEEPDGVAGGMDTLQDQIAEESLVLSVPGPGLALGRSVVCNALPVPEGFCLDDGLSFVFRSGIPAAEATSWKPVLDQFTRGEFLVSSCAAETLPGCGGGFSSGTMVNCKESHVSWWGCSSSGPRRTTTLRSNWTNVGAGGSGRTHATGVWAWAKKPAFSSRTSHPVVLAVAGTPASLLFEPLPAGWTLTSAVPLGRRARQQP